MNLLVRWRLNEPTEEFQERWTKVHRIRKALDSKSRSRTECGMVIPDFPYMADYDNDIPATAPVCQRCLKAR